MVRSSQRHPLLRPLNAEHVRGAGSGGSPTSLLEVGGAYSVQDRQAGTGGHRRSSPCLLLQPQHCPTDPKSKQKPALTPKRLKEVDEGVAGRTTAAPQTKIILGAAEPCTAKMPMGVGQPAFVEVVVDVHTSYLSDTSITVVSSVADHDLKLIQTPPAQNIAANNQPGDGRDSRDW